MQKMTNNHENPTCTKPLLGVVLSLFDGMSCGQIALNKAGIFYGKYYASEIDKHAIHDLLRMARWLVVVYYGLGEVERIANDYLKR